MSDVLSQEEIDALLEGVRNGDVAPGHFLSDPDAEIQDYDLGSEDKITRGKLPSMEMINQRFARYFAVNSFSILRTPLDIKVGELKMQKYGDYVTALSAPSNINRVSIPRLDATSLVVLNEELVNRCVDLFFGGSGDVESRQGKSDFSPTELRVVRRLMGQIFEDLRSAWNPVIELEFDYQNTESNPRFANYFSPSEIVLITDFQLMIDDRELGRMDITIPYSALEPFREALDSGLQSDQAEKHSRWRDALGNRLNDTDVEVRSVLTRTSVKLKQLTRFKVGDIIPIDMPETLTVSAKDIPLFSAVFGSHKGVNAVKILEPILPEKSGATVQ